MEKEIKSTPGPWKLHFELRDSVLTETVTHEFPIVEFEDGYKLWITPFHRPHAELIAQAPIMYEFIKRLADSGDQEAKQIIYG